MKRRDMLKKSLFSFLGLGVVSKSAVGKSKSGVSSDFRSLSDEAIIKTTWYLGNIGLPNFIVTSGSGVSPDGVIYRISGYYSKVPEVSRNYLHRQSSGEKEIHCLQIDRCNVKEGWVKFTSQEERIYLDKMEVKLFDKDLEDIAVIVRNGPSDIEVFWKRR